MIWIIIYCLFPPQSSKIGKLIFRASDQREIIIRYWMDFIFKYKFKMRFKYLKNEKKIFPQWLGLGIILNRFSTKFCCQNQILFDIFTLIIHNTTKNYG